METVDNFIWVEKYRPKTIADCVLEEDIKKKIQKYLLQKDLPHFLFFGSAGTGKSSCAVAIANELEMEYIFINASLDSNIDLLRDKVSHFARTVSYNRKKKVIILDEVDSVSSSYFFPALRPIIEQFSKNCVFIMTCNNKDKVPDAIQSRLQPIEFTIVNKKAHAEKVMVRLEEILENEKITYNRKIVASVIKNAFPDIRKMINFLQLNSESLTDEKVIYKLEGVNIKPLIDALVSGDAEAVRKIIEEDYILLDNIYTLLYNNFKNFVTKETLPNAILITDDYMRSHSLVIDKSIHVMAYLIDFCKSCSFIKEK